MAQTNWVITQLKQHHPDNNYTIQNISTKGDTDERPLFTIEQKGIFEKEIDRAVSEGTVDFAVHSMKDVPSTLDESLTLACVPVRESVHDVLITNDGANLASIKPGSVIGTSSLRRAVQVQRIRKDVTVKPIRGNIETRINKINTPDFDAIILAEAGINRLGLGVQLKQLTTDEFAPSPGQGALAIIARKDSAETIMMLQSIQDKTTRAEVDAERALSNFVESGCRFPVGAYAKTYGAFITLQVVAFSVDGSKALVVTKSGPKDEPEQIGKAAAEELHAEGLEELALNWRESVQRWNES
jgi:hydroxymethylbilane synthase